MAKYCVNRKPQDNGDHEVHDLDIASGCLPRPEHRLDLGSHPNCQSAVTAAKHYYPKSNGCAFCAPACHTQ